MASGTNRLRSFDTGSLDMVNSDLSRDNTGTNVSTDSNSDRSSSTYLNTARFYQFPSPSSSDRTLTQHYNVLSTESDQAYITTVYKIDVDTGDESKLANHSCESPTAQELFELLTSEIQELEQADARLTTLVVVMKRGLGRIKEQARRVGGDDMGPDERRWSDDGDVVDMLLYCDPGDVCKFLERRG